MTTTTTELIDITNTTDLELESLLSFGKIYADAKNIHVADALRAIHRATDTHPLYKAEADAEWLNIARVIANA